jgi:protein-S-isoprenylcysteine O-methyltransferase Ste14
VANAVNGVLMPATIFEFLWAAGFVAGCLIRGLYARRHTRDEIHQRRATRLDTLLVALSSLGLVFLPLVYMLTRWLDFADYGLPRWAGQMAGWAGAAVFAAALWLLWRSHVDLGRQWSPLLEITRKHSLVTRGAFRHVRHPMYAAHWLWGIAQALLLQNWIAGPALLVFFLPLYLTRVPREEAMMLDHFGEAYRQYMSRTGRLIPPLRRRPKKESTR